MLTIVVDEKLDDEVKKRFQFIHLPEKCDDPAGSPPNSPTSLTSEPVELNDYHDTTDNKEMESDKTNKGASILLHYTSFC